MLFSNGAPGGYLCIVPGFVFAPYQIVGGTGRYAGASGYWQAEIETHPFGGPAGGVVGETGVVTGEIILPWEAAGNNGRFTRPGQPLRRCIWFAAPEGHWPGDMAVKEVMQDTGTGVVGH